MPPRCINSMHSSQWRARSSPRWQYWLVWPSAFSNVRLFPLPRLWICLSDVIFTGLEFAYLRVWEFPPSGGVEKSLPANERQRLFHCSCKIWLHYLPSVFLQVKNNIKNSFNPKGRPSKTGGHKLNFLHWWLLITTGKSIWKSCMLPSRQIFTRSLPIQSVLVTVTNWTYNHPRQVRN